MGSRLVEGRSPVETSSTTVTLFVDTNVLVYAEDKDAKSKREVASRSFWDAMVVEVA